MQKERQNEACICICLDQTITREKFKIKLHMLKINSRVIATPPITQGTWKAKKGKNWKRRCNKCLLSCNLYQKQKWDLWVNFSIILIIINPVLVLYDCFKYAKSIPYDKMLLVADWEFATNNKDWKLNRTKMLMAKTMTY